MRTSCGKIWEPWTGTSLRRILQNSMPPAPQRRSIPTGTSRVSRSGIRRQC